MLSERTVYELIKYFKENKEVAKDINTAGHRFMPCESKETNFY